MKKRFSLFSAEGLLLRSLILVAVQLFLMWFLAGKNIVAALLAPSAQTGRFTVALALLFMLTRLFTVYIAPGFIAGCLAVLLLRKLGGRRNREFSKPLMAETEDTPTIEP